MKYRRLITTSPVLALALAAAQAQACGVAGRVDGLLLGTQKVSRLEVAQMSIEREGRTLRVDDGMPVCEDDLISVRAGVVAIVRVGNEAQKDNTITLFGEAVITVEDPFSITARLGRFFALLRGRFDVRTNFGTLGARGTQFEVNATPGAARVVQLEGDVQLTRPDSQSGPLVKPLQSLDLSVATSAPMDISKETCAGVTATHSAVISDTRPELPFEASGRSADRETIARDFAEARQNVLCERQPGAAPELARAWADYAEPGGVLKILEKVPPPTDNKEGAIYANSAGNAYRQLGQSEAALSWYQRAIGMNDKFAFPYNGIGDVHRDRGLAFLGSGNSADALREFDLARRWYEDSLNRNLEGKEGGINRAIPMVNLGELALLRIAAEPAESAALLELSQQWLEQARQTAGVPYAFAELGLARLDLMRAAVIPNVVIDGPSGWEFFELQFAAEMAVTAARKVHTDAAERRLTALLETHPGFSAASLLRGEVRYFMNDQQNAKEDFRAAVRFDPHNTLAYLKLSQELKARRERAERALYEAAYNSAAFPDQKPVLVGKAKVVDAAKPRRSQVRDMRALVASVDPVVFSRKNSGKPETIAFTNTGPAAVTVGPISIDGNDAAGFAVQPGSCANRELRTNESCEVQVGFVGDRARNWSARLVVGNSAGVDARVGLKAVVEALRNGT